MSSFVSKDGIAKVPQVPPETPTINEAPTAIILEKDSLHSLHTWYFCGLGLMILFIFPQFPINTPAPPLIYKNWISKEPSQIVKKWSYCVADAHLRSHLYWNVLCISWNIRDIPWKRGIEKRELLELEKGNEACVYSTPPAGNNFGVLGLFIVNSNLEPLFSPQLRRTFLLWNFNLGRDCLLRPLLFLAREKGRHSITQ